MKTTIFFFLGLLLLAASRLGAAPTPETADLTIYAYDSFVSEWGPAGKVIPKFEEKYGVTVSVVSVGDAGQVLSRVILEKDQPRADIVIGIDNNLLARAIEEDILEPYRSPNIELIPEELRFDPSFAVTPFDYGYFALVWDSEKLDTYPESLEMLTSSKYRKKLILEDPRTSSPGLGFLLWTIAVYGEDYLDYWRRLKPNILTITAGWDTAYGMFTAGEAPLVLSYSTSPAYHVEYEGSTRYRALIFKEGNYLQIEGMGILKGARNPALARQFIDFSLTVPFQEEIPLTNWMYPVNPGAKVPDSFRYAPQPKRPLTLKPEAILLHQDRWLKEWARLVSK